MLRVGLTGGVGSGKSAAAAMLRSLGAQVSQSDEIGRALMQPGQAVYDRIVEHFGAEVLTAEGTLSRSVLARIAFEDGRVEELNGIVHPSVIAAQNQWMKRVAEDDPVAVAVVESALVFETKYGGDDESLVADGASWRSRFDRIVLVTAPMALRRQRYIERVSGFVGKEAAEDDFVRRDAAQWTDERKAALSDFVVVNDGSLHEMEEKLAALYAVLQSESVDRAAQSM